MLLQITEPAQRLSSSHDIPRYPAVGIDLGTTHSLVAISRERKPVILKGHGNISGILPSVVCYRAGKKPVVGASARSCLGTDAPDVIFSAKRFMGKGDDTTGNSVVSFSTSHGPKTPVEISAAILKVLTESASDALGHPVTHAVITVPAYFDDLARTATRDAARLAGLEVLRLLNEPTAAALAYGLDKGVDGLYAVYDLGGGTFDFSVLRLRDGVFQVLATGGDTLLGGDDIDEAFLDFITRKYALNLDESQETRKSWMQWARFLKEQLSTMETAESPLPGGTDSMKVAVSRLDLELCACPIMDKTIMITQLVLEDAGIQTNDLSGVILVGGATRMPFVVHKVQSFFGHKPLQDIDPDQAVALGAALHAEALTGESDIMLLDVAPLSLGIETMGGLVEVIIPRNSPIPFSKNQEFTTSRDGQTAILLHVVQGERPLVRDCRSLGRFELRGIPPMPAGRARIEVRFAVDADGVLTVCAREKTTGIEQSVRMQPASGLSREQVNQMLLEAFDDQDIDRKESLLVKANMEADRILLALESALEDDTDLLNSDESAQLRAGMEELKRLKNQKDPEALRNAVRKLDEDSHFLALRRINRATGEFPGEKLQD